MWRSWWRSATALSTSPPHLSCLLRSSSSSSLYKEFSPGQGVHDVEARTKSDRLPHLKYFSRKTRRPKSKKGNKQDNSGSLVIARVKMTGNELFFHPRLPTWPMLMKEIGQIPAEQCQWLQSLEKSLITSKAILDCNLMFAMHDTDRS